MSTNSFLTALLSLLLIGQISFAQKREIRGTVTERSKKEPLPGVSIRIKGTSSGTITDLDGKYRIIIGDTCTLVFSFVGFTSQEVSIKAGQQTCDITMNEDNRTIEEVVVVGYGTVTKKEVTGSCVMITSDSRVAKVSPTAIMEKKKEADESYDLIESAEGGFEGAKISEAASNNDIGIKSGQLTAGEVNDFSKWKLWNDISAETLREHCKHWRIEPKDRFSFQLTDKNDLPAIDQKIELWKEEQLIWTTRTDNTGKAELWDNLFEESFDNNAQYSIRTECKGKQYKHNKTKPFAKGMNHQRVKAKLEFPNIADIAIVLDATGSMEDELRYLEAELNDVIKKVKDAHQDLSLRLGSLVYRDIGDEYVTRDTPLDQDISKTIDFLKAQKAEGGGDTPEAVDSALSVAVNHFQWSEQARARLLFLVLDASPHDNPSNIQKIHELTQEAAKKGIKIIPVVCSGAEKDTEYLMRSMALATNGTYIFLTDDSGIGNSHIKPTTDKWVVEHLNELLIRVINQYLFVPEVKENKLAEDSASIRLREKIVAQQDNGFLTTDSIAAQYTDDLKPEDLAFDLKLYPNPCSGKLNIDLNTVAKELYLCDLSGKILEKFICEQQTRINIDLSAYPNGLYFIKYPFRGKWKAGRVVLLH